MSTFSTEQPKSVSNVRFLPIIDLNLNDPNALFSLLSYISKQCDKLSTEETCVTHDQPLYIKDHEIVSSEKLKIFFRLGGFHQIMSFFGSVGNLMEGSGLGEALEEIYSPNTVSHTFTGKAYARALRGHLLRLCYPYLEPFFENLPEQDLNRIMALSSFNDIQEVENDSVISTLF